MVGNLPIWFNLTTYSFGIIFLCLSYRIGSKKQISLLGNMGKLKKEKDLNIVCNLTGMYTFILGASIIMIPMVNLVFDLYAVVALVGAIIIGSLIFWFTLPKVYFTPSEKEIIEANIH